MDMVHENPDNEIDVSTCVDDSMEEFEICITNIYTPKQDDDNERVLQVPDPHIGKSTVGCKKFNSALGLSEEHCDQVKYMSIMVDTAIERDVCAVLIPGDFFDKVFGISDRLWHPIQQQLLRLTKAGIALVIIVGNHDLPKTREYKAMIARYDGIGEYLNVAVVYKGVYEKVNINDKILVHCVPFNMSKDEFREQIALAKRDDAYDVNILMTHTSIQGAGIDEYQHSEAWLNKAELDNTFDHIALGDYHRPIKVADKAYYAGALFRNTFGEKDNENCFILFDGKDGTVEKIPYETRGMSEFVINCEKKLSDAINKEILDIVDSFDEENYIKVKFKNIKREQAKEINFDPLKEIRKRAFFYKVEFEYIDTVVQSTSVSNVIKSKTEELHDVIDIFEVPDSRKERMKQKYEMLRN